MVAASAFASAQSLTAPQDPTQSITYWKPHVVAPEADALVAQVQKIFSVLLRTWDGPQVEPNLYVVQSTGGAWAASLADGNILLSRSAIDICQQFGQQKAQHLMAFILSHELAHQKSNDLWHQKFLRLAVKQTPEVQQLMLKGLSLSTDEIRDLEQREAQADHDGLVAMSSVGFDPFAVVDDKDFFTTWVENIWSASCPGGSDADMNRAVGGSNEDLSAACNQARTRAVRAKAQLSNVAAQSTLFDLGVQSFIAGRYQTARHYFSSYGKDYPSRAVYTNIALSFLAQAIDVEKEIAALDDNTIRFYYPLLLNTDPFVDAPAEFAAGKRGGRDVRISQLKTQKHNFLESAVTNLEKAIRLDPRRRQSFILLATAYLLDNNTFMARGIVQGKYIPQFDSDADSELLLSMTSALEGKITQAEQALLKLLSNTSSAPVAKSVLPRDLYSYTLHYNLAVVLRKNHKAAQARQVWESLAHVAKKHGESLLFQLALKELSSSLQSQMKPKEDARIESLRVGDRYMALSPAVKTVSDIWLDGEKFQVVRRRQGVKLLITANDEIVSIWQDDESSVATVLGLNMGDGADRPYKLFGMPSRHVQLIDGEYLAYDALSIAIRVVNDKVAGWFLYQSP
jgi:tetratricopeptide (TPR) repeat protein